MVIPQNQIQSLKEHETPKKIFCAFILAKTIGQIIEGVWILKNRSTDSASRKKYFNVKKVRQISIFVKDSQESKTTANKRSEYIHLKDFVSIYSFIPQKQNLRNGETCFSIFIGYLFIYLFIYLLTYLLFLNPLNVLKFLNSSGTFFHKCLPFRYNTWMLYRLFLVQSSFNKLLLSKYIESILFWKCSKNTKTVQSFK